MINFEQLDRTKTYIALQYGESQIAKAIAKCTKKYAPNCERIPTHVLALYYRADLKDWWIYESHLVANKEVEITSGVRHYDRVRFFNAEEKALKQFFTYEMPFNVYMLEKYLGEKYGTRDITALLRADLLNRNGKQSNKKGLICSEYLALAYPHICDFFNLSAHCITPAHWAQYLKLD